MPAQSQLTPLGQRCLRLAGLLALLLIAVVVNYVAHGGTDGLNPVAEAAERTAEMPGSHIAIEVKYSSPSSPTTLVGTGGGVFDARTGRTDVSLSMPIPGSQALSIEAISTPRKVFMRSSAFEGELPPGKLWLALEPLLGGSEKTVFASNDSAKGMLEALEAVGGGVDREDQQTVRGHLTTRYKGKIDPAKVIDVLQEKGEAKLAHAYETLVEKAPQTIGVEVWIDGRGLVRQISMVQQIPITEGTDLNAETRMQFYDFGSHPTIVTPRRDQVFDYTPVLHAEVGLMEGRSLGPLTPPAGEQPLPVGAFRRRAKGICEATLDKARPLVAHLRRIDRQYERLGPDSLADGSAKPLVRRTGAWLEGPIYALGTNEISRLKALAPPSDYAAAYRHYLTIYVQQAEFLLAKARAFQLGAYRVPDLETKPLEAEQKKELKSLAAQMGIQACEKELNPGPAATSQAA